MTTILADGNFNPLFARAMAGSVHFVIFPRKIPASACGVNFNSLVTPGVLYVGTTAPSTVGKCRTGDFDCASCASVIGASDAPKSTVPARSCLIPAPEPTD